MGRILKWLSHPAWTGIGAIFAGLGTILMGVSIYLMIYPVPPIKPDVNQEGSAAVGPDVEVQTPSGPRTPQDDVNEIIKHTLGSINSSYRGMHSRFNEGPSLGFLAAVLLAIGIGVLVSNLRARA
jgi:hypothetical protein